MSEYVVCPHCHNPLSQNEWVKVVRCRDCRWCMAYSNATYCDRFAHALPTSELDGFCAWGDKKKDGDD